MMPLSTSWKSKNAENNKKSNEENGKKSKPKRKKKKKEMAKNGNLRKKNGKLSIQKITLLKTLSLWCALTLLVKIENSQRRRNSTL